MDVLYVQNGVKLIRLVAVDLMVSTAQLDIELEAVEKRHNASKSARVILAKIQSMFLVSYRLVTLSAIKGN